MAGSLIDARYTTDSGQIYYITVDRSNWEQANAGNVGEPVQPADNKLPGNITPRKILYRSADRLSQVLVPIRSRDLFNAAPDAIPNYRGVQCLKTALYPEKRKLGRPVDTGNTSP